MKTMFFQHAMFENTTRYFTPIYQNLSICHVFFGYNLVVWDLFWAKRRPSFDHEFAALTLSRVSWSHGHEMSTEKPMTSPLRGLRGDILPGIMVIPWRKVKVLTFNIVLCPGREVAPSFASHSTNNGNYRTKTQWTIEEYSVVPPKLAGLIVDTSTIDDVVLRQIG